MRIRSWIVFITQQKACISGGYILGKEQELNAFSLEALTLNKPTLREKEFYKLIPQPFYNATMLLRNNNRHKKAVHLLRYFPEDYRHYALE